MSNIKTFPFDVAGNYTIGAGAKVASGEASLSLEDNIGQNFNQSFDSDVGFTYDSDKTEFSAGQVQQKNLLPAGATCGASYNSSIDLESWSGGSVTGVASGGASVSGGKLDLTGGTAKNVVYDADLNADSQQTGCVRFKWTPNYTGAPSSVNRLVTIQNTAVSVNNRIWIYHTSTLLFWQIFDSAGATIVSQAETFSPVAGTEYEVELNWDSTAGATRLFINGVQLSTTNTGIGVRNSSIGYLQIGQATSDFYFDDLMIFNTVQHTANYTPGYTAPETIYSGDVITLPTFTYAGLGAIQIFSDFQTSQSGIPKYIMNGQYWDGAAWSISNDSYAQANTPAEILTNIPTLTASDTLTVKAITQDTDTQAALSDLSVEYTGQIYLTTNPTVVINETWRLDGLMIFTETATKVGSDEIKYILTKEAIEYYHNGTGWVVSDGTYAQSNTAAEINTNIATFTTIPITFAVKILLHSDDGSTSPSLQTLAITYDFAGEEKETVSVSKVWGYISTVGNASKEAVTITAKLNADSVQYKNNIVVSNDEVSVESEANGYFELSLVETDNMAGTPKYDITLGELTLTRGVPNVISQTIWELPA